MRQMAFIEIARIRLIIIVRDCGRAVRIVHLINPIQVVIAKLRLDVARIIRAGEQACVGHATNSLVIDQFARPSVVARERIRSRECACLLGLPLISEPSQRVVFEIAMLESGA